MSTKIDAHDIEVLGRLADVIIDCAVDDGAMGDSARMQWLRERSLRKSSVTAALSAKTPVTTAPTRARQYTAGEVLFAVSTHLGLNQVQSLFDASGPLALNNFSNFPRLLGVVQRCANLPSVALPYTMDEHAKRYVRELAAEWDLEFKRASRIIKPRRGHEIGRGRDWEAAFDATLEAHPELTPETAETYIFKRSIDEVDFDEMDVDETQVDETQQSFLRTFRDKLGYNALGVEAFRVKAREWYWRDLATSDPRTLSSHGSLPWTEAEINALKEYIHGHKKTSPISKASKFGLADAIALTRHPALQGRTPGKILVYVRGHIEDLCSGSGDVRSQAERVPRNGFSDAHTARGLKFDDEPDVTDDEPVYAVLTLQEVMMMDDDDAAAASSDEDPAFQPSSRRKKVLVLSDDGMLD